MSVPEWLSALSNQDGLVSQSHCDFPIRDPLRLMGSFYQGVTLMQHSPLHVIQADPVREYSGKCPPVLPAPAAAFRQGLGCHQL